MSSMTRTGADVTPTEQRVRDLDWVHTTMSNNVPEADFAIVSHTRYCTREMQEEIAACGLRLYEWDSHAANDYLRFHVIIE